MMYHDLSFEAIARGSKTRFYDIHPLYAIVTVL